MVVGTRRRTAQTNKHTSYKNKEKRLQSTQASCSTHTKKRTKKKTRIIQKKKNTCQRAAIVLDIVETRFPWRNFATEWLVAAAMTASYAVACLVLANIDSASSPLLTIVPQILASILVYPLVCRFVALIDRLRLVPVMVID